MDILISKDRSLLYFDGKVSNLDTKTSMDIFSLSINETIDIFKRQSNELLKENNENLLHINSIIRSLGHLINEDLNVEDKQFFLFELENKLNINLLVESVNDSILLTEQAWDWVKDKAGKAWDATKSGVKWVGNKLSDVGKYLWNKGLPGFFDKLRDFCYSPIGIGLDVALTVAIPAAGKVVMSVVFGALLLWEIKELIEKGPGWETILNVIFASIGVLVPALSKSGKAAVGGAKSLGAIPIASRGIIVKMIEMGKGMISKIVSVAGKGAEWLAGLFGSGAKSWMSGILKSLETTLTKVFNFAGKKIVGGGEKLTSTKLAAGISKGAKTAIIWSGINMGLHKFMNSEIGQKAGRRISKLFGGSGADYNEEDLRKMILEDNPSLKNPKKIEFNNNDNGQPELVMIDGVQYRLNFENPENKALLIPIKGKLNNTPNNGNNIITNYDSIWDYMEKDGKYYAKKKDSDKWVLTNGNVSLSIKNKVYNK